MGNSCQIQSPLQSQEVLRIPKQVPNQPTKQNPLEQFNYDVKSHLDAFEDEFYSREFSIEDKDKKLININLCTSLGCEVEENLKKQNSSPQVNNTHSLLSYSAIQLNIYPTSSLVYVDYVPNKNFSKSHQSLDRTIERAQKRSREERRPNSSSSKPKSILKSPVKNKRSFSPVPKGSSRNIVRFNLQQETHEKKRSNSPYRIRPKLVQQTQK